MYPIARVSGPSSDYQAGIFSGRNGVKDSENGNLKEIKALVMSETNLPPNSSPSAIGSVPGREPNVPAQIAVTLPAPASAANPDAVAAAVPAAAETPAPALLTPVEIRVLGCLIEKQFTTPEYYPLTLHALTAACNQKNNRDPEVDFDEKTVVKAIDSLRQKGLAVMHTGSGLRVPKYEHMFTHKFPVDPRETAVLCELLLRGPQTVGELRNRASRMHGFTSLEEVESILDKLGAANPPLTLKLEKLPGRKESRYAQLFGGKPEVKDVDTNKDGKASWAEVKSWQLLHGDTVQKPESRPYAISQFPVVRCYWYQYPNGYTNISNKTVVNLAADLRTIFLSQPWWEKDLQ